MKKDIHQLFDEFLFEREFVGKAKPRTLLAYQNTFKQFTTLHPDISTEALDKTVLIHFFKQLQERKRIVGKGVHKTGIKKSTAATYWSKLNTFFDWLQRNNHIHSNPFDTLPYPTPSYEEKKYLRKQDLERIVTAIHIHHDNNLFILKRNLVIFYLLLFCGLRREELLLLQIRDIDLERKAITVRGESSKSGVTRQIPLHSICLLHLRDFLSIRKSYTSPYLIVSSNKDERLSLDGLKHFIKKMNHYSGVRFHLHQFRHTFAVNFLKSSNNIAKLKQLLGHKNITMTLAYLRCLPVHEMRSDIETMSLDTLL